MWNSGEGDGEQPSAFPPLINLKNIGCWDRGPKPPQFWAIEDIDEEYWLEKRSSLGP